MQDRKATAQLPELPLEAWRDAKTTLHLYSQIIGKVRLALHPKWNHWWHVSLYPSARGLTTGAIPVDIRLVELEFDFIAHALTIRSSQGEASTIPLRSGLSVAEFYTLVMRALTSMNIQAHIQARPYDPSRAGSDIPFEQDKAHHHYDPSQVERFHRILGWSYGVFAEFRGWYAGKSTPPHFFWHSFDLALTRFSGRRAALPEGADAVTKEAYSHEVISFGFWPGDAVTPEPAYYAYAAPEPPGLREAPLRPAAARWTGEASALAILPYAEVRREPNPKAAVLEFLQSTFDAGAAGEDRWRLE